MNTVQEASREEGEDEKSPSFVNTIGGGNVEIGKNNVATSTEPTLSPPPQVIATTVAVTENHLISTVATAIVSEIPISTADTSTITMVSAVKEDKVPELAGYMAVKLTDRKAEPKSDREEQMVSEEKAAELAVGPRNSDTKLETQVSGGEGRLGSEDKAVEPTNYNTETETQKSSGEERLVSEGMSTDSASEEEQTQNSQNPEISETPNKSSDTAKPSDEDEDEEEPPPKKQKQLSLLNPPHTPATGQQAEAGQGQAQLELEVVNSHGSNANGKKSTKKKSENNNLWTKPTSRTGKKKSKNNTSQSIPKVAEETVWIIPVPRFPDKNDDSPDMKICLSKVYKAEKVELSDDRLSAGSCDGYRMVRATRGITEGSWYFEIKVVSLDETGHTRLGWSTQEGDLQAPVGYDANSFGYRDIDGSKIYKALRGKYGEEGYKEGDVIGFYINLPDGNRMHPTQLVSYKGQKYVCAPDAEEEPPKTVPECEISFFKNGVCQGVAFKDLYGGGYYPAASMYTLPNQPNCVVRFNSGPDSECYPEDFGGRPAPRPMIEVPYHGFDSRTENGESTEKNQQ